MKKKLVISAFFIGILLSFSVFGINYLPIFGKFIATAYAEKYVMAQYGEELKYPCRYDLYNGHYTGEMAEGSSIIYSIRSNTMADHRLSGKVHRRAARDYELYDGLPPNIQKSGSPHISVSFKANDWEKKSYGLYMGGRNTEKITAEESPERAAETAAYIMEDLWPDYNFTSVQFIYYDINGVHEVNCRDKKGIILEKMLEMSQKNLPICRASFMNSGVKASRRRNSKIRGTACRSFFIVRYNGHIASESIEKAWTIFDRIVNCGRIKLKGITMKGDEKWSTMPGRKTAADAGKR